MKSGARCLDHYDMGSLRIPVNGGRTVSTRSWNLVSGGESDMAAAPIIDTWWQTEPAA